MCDAHSLPPPPPAQPPMSSVSVVAFRERRAKSVGGWKKTFNYFAYLEDAVWCVLWRSNGTKLFELSRVVLLGGGHALSLLSRRTLGTHRTHARDGGLRRLKNKNKWRKDTTQRRYMWNKSFINKVFRVSGKNIQTQASSPFCISGAAPQQQQQFSFRCTWNLAIGSR